MRDIIKVFAKIKNHTCFLASLSQQLVWPCHTPGTSPLGVMYVHPDEEASLEQVWSWQSVYLAPSHGLLTLDSEGTRAHNWCWRQELKKARFCFVHMPIYDQPCWAMDQCYVWSSFSFSNTCKAFFVVLYSAKQPKLQSNFACRRNSFSYNMEQPCRSCPVLFSPIFNVSAPSFSA